MLLKERNIEAGDFTYGERIQLARILSQEEATDYKIIADIIECLHKQRPTPKEAATYEEYAIKVRDRFLEWLNRESTELYIPPTPEEIQAGVDQMSKECGDMGTLVSMAEKFGWTFEQILAMPYTDIFTIMKVQTERAKYERRLAEVYNRKAKSKA